MRGEAAGGTHDGDKRLQRHSLGKPWSKYRGKLGGGYGVIGTHIRGQGETSGAGKQGFGDAEM